MITTILISLIVSSYCSVCYITCYDLNNSHAMKEGRNGKWGAAGWIAFYLAPISVPVVCGISIGIIVKQLRGKKETPQKVQECEGDFNLHQDPDGPLCRDLKCPDWGRHKKHDTVVEKCGLCGWPIRESGPTPTPGYTQCAVCGQYTLKSSRQPKPVPDMKDPHPGYDCGGTCAVCSIGRTS